MVSDDIKDLSEWLERGDTPTVVYGNGESAHAAYEAMNRVYNEGVKSIAKSSGYSWEDQPRFNRWYVRRPDGGVSGFQYVSNATESEKNGALKMGLLNTFTHDEWEQWRKQSRK